MADHGEFRVAILTVSDRCARREMVDKSGPALVQLLDGEPFRVVKTSILPDARKEIAAWLLTICETDQADLILTTGGTGLGQRDITPEATLEVIRRRTPGIDELVRSASRAKTPFAVLSRAVSGVRRGTWIINLPGSPKGAVESLQAILPVLPHGLRLLRGAQDPHENGN